MRKETRLALPRGMWAATLCESEGHTVLVGNRHLGPDCTQIECDVSFRSLSSGVYSQPARDCALFALIAPFTLHLSLAASLHSFPVLLRRRESLVILGLLVTAQLSSSSKEFTV